MERRVVFFAYLGPGVESAEAFIVPEDWTNDMLDGAAWEHGVDFAQSYGVYRHDSSSGEDECDTNSYSWDDVEGYWEEYDAKKHNSRLTRGNEVEVSWNRL